MSDVWEQSGTGPGRTWLRAGILNHTATEADLDVLLDDIRDLAAGF